MDLEKQAIKGTEDIGEFMLSLGFSEKLQAYSKSVLNISLIILAFSFTALMQIKHNSIIDHKWLLGLYLISIVISLIIGMYLRFRIELPFWAQGAAKLLFYMGKNLEADLLISGDIKNAKVVNIKSDQNFNKLTSIASNGWPFLNVFNQFLSLAFGILFFFIYILIYLFK